MERDRPMTQEEINKYIDGLKPLNHDPIEEWKWQEDYQYVINNADCFSEAMVRHAQNCLKSQGRYRKPHVKSH